VILSSNGTELFMESLNLSSKVSISRFIGALISSMLIMTAAKVGDLTIHRGGLINFAVS
jgi:hypothetical protein